MKVDFTCKCGQIQHEEKIVDGEKKIVCSKCGEVYYTGSALREQDKLKEIYCVQCGQEGFKRIINNKNDTDVPALQCNNCEAILYDHETMIQLTKKD